MLDGLTSAWCIVWALGLLARVSLSFRFGGAGWTCWLSGSAFSVWGGDGRQFVVGMMHRKFCLGNRLIVNKSVLSVGKLGVLRWDKC